MDQVTTDIWSGLIWGIDVVDGRVSHISGVASIEVPPGGFRWLHVSLADERARRLIATMPLPDTARDILLSRDDDQRAWADEGTIACVIHDFTREFEDPETAHTGAIHFALTPTLMITARTHPVRCADVIKARIDAGDAPKSASAALNLMASAVFEIVSGVIRDLVRQHQAIEDALLEEDREPAARTLPLMRRRAVQAGRHLQGLHSVFTRLDEDEDLPEALQPIIGRLVQRAASLEADVMQVKGQTQLLRDELDLRANQRTNQNLYVLSIMTTLLLPATLVTGIFGMNTGGLPFANSIEGTMAACFVAVGASALTYMFLRMLGFFRGPDK